MHGFDWFRAATAWGGLRLVLVLESLLHSRVLTGREALLYAVSMLRQACDSALQGTNLVAETPLEFKESRLAACKDTSKQAVGPTSPLGRGGVPQNRAKPVG